MQGQLFSERKLRRFTKVGIYTLYIYIYLTVMPSRVSVKIHTAPLPRVESVVKVESGAFSASLGASVDFSVWILLCQHLNTLSPLKTFQINPFNVFPISAFAFGSQIMKKLKHDTKYFLLFSLSSTMFQLFTCTQLNFEYFSRALESSVKARAATLMRFAFISTKTTLITTQLYYLKRLHINGIYSRLPQRSF